MPCIDAAFMVHCLRAALFDQIGEMSVRDPDTAMYLLGMTFLEGSWWWIWAGLSSGALRRQKEIPLEEELDREFETLVYGEPVHVH